MFRIFKTEEFDRIFAKLDKSEQDRVEKIIEQLQERGDEIGKPLGGLSVFREKKFNGKRLYFLAFRNFVTVLVITIGDKKAQQATINRILLMLAEYKEYIIELLKKKGLT